MPGLGVTLVEKPVRGVVSNGMLCSAAELEQPSDADGILELSEDLAVGTAAANLFGAEAVIDFEVTPNRPDWLGVAGIARDLAATGLGVLKDLSVKPRRPGPSLAARSPSRWMREACPGLRRPADQGRQERPQPPPGCRTACAPSACARSTPWSISPT